MGGDPSGERLVFLRPFAWMRRVSRGTTARGSFRADAGKAAEAETAFVRSEAPP